MHHSYGILQAARFLLFGFFLFNGELIVDARGGSSGGGRGSSGARSSSSSSARSGTSSSWFGSGSHSSSSSNYGSSGGTHYGATVIHIHTHYRGGGYGSVYTSSDAVNDPLVKQVNYTSETPTITVNMIKSILFPRNRPSKEIFDYEDNPYRTRHFESDLDSLKHMSNKDNVQNFIRTSSERWNLLQQSLTEEGQKDPELQKKVRQLRESEQDEEVKIKEEKKAVIVGSIAFFWGDENLPRERGYDGCAKFSAVNDASNFTVCNVASLTRCQKSLRTVAHLGTKKFDDFYTSTGENVIMRKSNGNIADSFAWFCPQSEKCCEWECCATEEPRHEYQRGERDNDSELRVMCIVILIVFAICVCCCCAKAADRKAEEDNRSVNIAQQLSLEMEPMACDYPKQPRSNPQYVPPPQFLPMPQPQLPPQHGNARGNIGWNVKTVTAPLRRMY